MAGIYIHIPFCKQACYYCDFHFSTSLKNKAAMLAAIVKELELRKHEVAEEIETIYFGGGTPSLLTVDELQLVLDAIYQNYKVVESPEITLEANPDDLTSTLLNGGDLVADRRSLSGVEVSRNAVVERSRSDIFKAYKQIGINRLSIGIQSFYGDDLKTMNRAHTTAESINCLSEATRHFENITIDLIYGIPNMTEDRWRQNLQKAFDFGVSHISSYALTVEPKTALASFIKTGKYPPLDERLAAKHFDILVDETAKQGFIHYEISNFGKEGFFSKHNTSYWLGKQYVGIGPSAHSYNGLERSWNVANNTKYLKSIEQNILPSEKELLSVKDRFNEYIMTGLRTIWGVDMIKVTSEFGEDFYNHLLKVVEKYIDQKLLVIEDCHSERSEESQKTTILKTTAKGKFLADGIASDLFVI